MKIIKSNVASIVNNDQEIVDRVLLSIAQDDDGSYYIITDSSEDCGPHFKAVEGAENAIYEMWGKSSEWDLQYS